MLTGHSGSGSKAMEDFPEYQDLELNRLCDEELIESGEDRGDTITEPGVGENAGCRILDDLSPMERRDVEADKQVICMGLYV